MNKNWWEKNRKQNGKNHDIWGRILAQNKNIMFFLDF